MSEEQITMRARNNDLTDVSFVADRLRSIHMDAMADALLYLDETDELSRLTPLEAINRLAGIQLINNTNNATLRYKRQARLYWPSADLADIIYKQDRHINIALVDQFATNEYIRNSRNIMITSATGCGKTFFACAFGNRACEEQYTVRYFTMIDLLTEFQTAEARGRIVKFLNKLANTNLIVIDDFLLTSITARDTEYLYRLFDSKPRRNKARSFIICSQLMKEEMYTRLSSFSPGLADAIMNRLASRAYDFEIQGDSMRDVNIEKELQRQRETQLKKRSI